MRTNNQDTFATAFNCMDGRCQDAVAAYARKRWDVRWVDAITEPGLDGIIAGNKLLAEQPDHLLAWIERKARISGEGHKSKYAVVVGHQKCAGNPVDDSAHRTHINETAKWVRSLGLFEEVVCLYATETVDGDWGVSEVEEEAALAA